MKSKILSVIKSQKLWRVAASLALVAALISPVLPSTTAHAAELEIVAYPKLDAKLDYFKTEFPSGLRYSPGWYGTFTNAPTASKILLFDDVSFFHPQEQEWYGICVFALPPGTAPSGEQGGTYVKKISQAEADSLLKSYSIDAFTPYDTDIAEIVPEKYLWSQPHAGEKLEQRWQIVLSNKAHPVEENGVLYKVETVEVEKELDGEIITVEEQVKVPLTEKQITFLEEAENKLSKENTPEIELDLIKYDPPRYAILPADTTSLWSANTTWSASSGGATGASIPTNADEVYVDGASVAGAGAILLVDATAYCLSMDWTGALNTPTLAGSQQISIYGDLTLINNMNWTQSNNVNVAGAANVSWTFAGKTLPYLVSATSFTGKLTFVDALTLSFYMTWNAGTLDTNGQTFTLTGFMVLGTNTKTLTIGNSTINCQYVENTASGAGIPMFTANTATINVSGTGAVALGNANWNGASFNLTGTAHTVSGSPTGIATFTRTGTATKTDTVTFTSGANLTCGTFAMIGNSVTNRLLVQSSTLGTPATITATNWTGSANVDIMDITVTNPVDLSAITGGSGDCQGNTDITFTTAAAQVSAATGNWSTLATWQDGVGTDRVPLPQDDVTCSHSVTVDMPRIGKSITFTGTPTVTMTANDISIYGSFTVGTGVTASSNKVTFFRGRGSYNIDSAVSIGMAVSIRAVGGTYTQLKDTSFTSYFDLTTGTYNLNGYNLTISRFNSDSALSKELILGSGTVSTDYGGGVAYLWMVNNAGTFTLNAGTSTIILRTPTTNPYTFAGGGLTYNNVQVAGAGAYALTVKGNNVFNTFHVDRSQAAKTIIATDTNQTVNDFTRDTGTGVITLTGGTWTKSDATPLWLDYLNVTGSTASPVDTWFAGSHSTNGGGNTDWIFDDPAINVETISATGITMNKDGVTGGTLTGNVTTILHGTPRIPVHAEIGLTAAYGTNITGGMVYSSGLFAISVPVNQTPGATYHWRVVGETGNASSPFNGLDSTYVYTLPTFTTLPVSNESASGGSRATLNANVSNMGVASDSYVFFQWGYSPTALSNTGLHTVSGTGDTSSTLIGFNPTETIYYRSATTIGSVTTYGNIVSFAVSDGASNAMTILYNVGLVVIGLAICILVFILYRSAGGLVALIAAVVGILGFTIIKTFLESLW